MVLVRTAALPSVPHPWMVVSLPMDNLAAVQALEDSVPTEMGKLFAILPIVSAKIHVSPILGVPEDPC